MIVTRSWLEEFIDLSSVDDTRLYETLNSIGLEVDSIEKHVMPSNVVIGKIVECSKHPDADKLSVCQVDTGDGVKQIVCGAANVVNAEYVAVALTGAVLPDGMKIKKAKLRGVESEGMICSSSELGLPDTGEGIMILDESIGTLEIGKELGSYPVFTDTVIELELTANRGDCLSIHGVARDLAAALDIDMNPFSYTPSKYIKQGIARALNIKAKGDATVDLSYALVEMDSLKSALLVDLRLAFVGVKKETTLESVLAYTTHATGVVLRVYDMQKLKDQAQDAKIDLYVKNIESGIVEVCAGEKPMSIVGIKQFDNCSVSGETKEILVEASYADPVSLVDFVSESKTETDDLYYRTSRGSEPNLKLGICYMAKVCDESGECSFSDTPLAISREQKPKVVSVDAGNINEIIGKKVAKKRIHEILSRLGFGIHKSTSSDVFGATIPEWRHDIENEYDVAEEIMRMIGINSIPGSPLSIPEANRIGSTTELYKKKRDIRLKAVAAGFFEAVTYLFSDRKVLDRLGFETVSPAYDLKNPIVDEMNTLRTTLLTNLLESVKRNMSYGKKKIPLFEIGSVYDKARSESEKIAFVWCGEVDEPSVSNHGKAPKIDLPSFVGKLSAVLGDFALEACEVENGMMHPYLSASIVIDGKRVGYLSKLHPEVALEMDIIDTFFAELDLETILPAHKNASPVSNFQGVYKDISILVEDSISYKEIADVLREMEMPVIKNFFPVDIYRDEQFAGKKSLTLRLYLQSDSGTLSDTEIESAMKTVLETTGDKLGAVLR